MTKRLLILLFFYLGYTGGVIAQQTAEGQLPSQIYKNAIDLMESKNFAGARNYFEQYLSLQSATTYRLEATYYRAICALKLYHLDGEQLIKNFIEKYPHSLYSSRAYIELGEYFFQDRNYKQAINYLSKVYQQALPKKKKGEIQYKLGYSYFAVKNFSKALNEFNKVKKVRGEYQAPAQYYAAFAEYDQQLYNLALEDYLAIRQNKAFASTVPYMITSIYYKSGQYDKLVTYAKAIIDGNKKVQKEGQMAILLAEAYYELANYRDAYFYFNQAHKSVKFTAQSVYHYGVSAARSNHQKSAIRLLKSVAGQNNKVGVLASYELGKLYVEDKNYEFAFTSFKSVMENKHAEALTEQAHLTAGKLAYELGRYSECISLLTDFKKHYPDSEANIRVDDILAQAFLNTRNYKPALDYIESISVKSNSIWQAYQVATFYYGVSLYNDRKFAKAITYFKKSLEHSIAPEYTLRANLWIAEAYAIGRKYKTALPFYNTATSIKLQVNPDEYWRAVYGRGYAYYNTANYGEARKDFASYVNNVSKNNNLYGDAMVRLADCYYVEKDYTTALQYFTRAIRGVINEKDYAYYQTGVIYGILNEYEKALSYLNRVINVYITSAYYDDALFERGFLQLKHEHFKDAINSLDKLIEEKPRSPYIAFALERSAVANFNLGNYSKTVNLYKRLIDNYPNNPGISDALIGLQESMRLTNRADDFEAFLQAFKKKNPDVGGLEKVEFESLKSFYNNQNYAKAARGFAGYLNTHPEDINATEAKYLLAESLYRLNMPDSALNLYHDLYKVGGDFQAHRIAERIADLEYSRHNIIEANKYYNSLVKIAISNNQKLRAWMGLMNGYYQLANYDSTMYYADKLIEDGGNRNDFIVAATLKKGLALLNLGRYDNALLLFEKTTELAKDKYGAEAQYYIGLILHQQGDFANANEALYIIPEQYGMYTEWLDKAFLLVAENFIAMKEYFQAKATLQSIIDNSADENTIKTATDRYDWVTNEEAKEVNLVPDSLNTVEIDTSSNNDHD